MANLGQLLWLCALLGPCPLPSPLVGEGMSQGSTAQQQPDPAVPPAAIQLSLQSTVRAVNSASARAHTPDLRSQRSLNITLSESQVGRDLKEHLFHPFLAKPWPRQGGPAAHSAKSQKCPIAGKGKKRYGVKSHVTDNREHWSLRFIIGLWQGLGFGVLLTLISRL